MSAEDERSPKRQRRSYSPASPPEATQEQKSFVRQPQTPPPSVHMSPSWQSQQLPGLIYAGNGPVTFPTPPSTAGLQSQILGIGTSSEGRGGIDSGDETPAHESEVLGSTRGEGERDVHMSEPQPVLEEGDVLMTDDGTDAEHRRSNHERQEVEDTASVLSGARVLYKLQTERKYSQSMSAHLHSMLNTLRL